jgi:deoxyadenosine/deoxycytidine kinase
VQNADLLEAAVAAEYREKLGRVHGHLGGHVLVLGHSASGKTTAAIAAAKARAYQYTYDSALLQSDRFAHYTAQLFAGGDKQAFLPYEVEALLVRFLQNRGPKPNWICDQGIHSIWAYARARRLLDDLDAYAYQTIYALFLTLASESPLPRLVVRFRCEATEAIKRVRTRGRPHELSALTVEFLEELDRAYGHVVASFPAGVPTELIDTTNLDQSAVLCRLLATIDAHTTA